MQISDWKNVCEGILIKQVIFTCHKEDFQAAIKINAEVTRILINRPQIIKYLKIFLKALKLQDPSGELIVDLYMLSACALFQMNDRLYTKQIKMTIFPSREFNLI